MTPHICIDFFVKSVQGWIQGRAKIGHGGPLLQRTSSSDWKATASFQGVGLGCERCCRGKQEARRAMYRAPEYNLPPMLTYWPERPSWLAQKHEKHTNLVEDVAILSPKCLSQSEAR